MEKRELTCIGCPLGCQLTVALEGKTVQSVEGYTCKRGKDYGEKECTHPMRTVTSSVRVEHGVFPMVSVKTAADIPKEKILVCMAVIHGLKAEAPVRMGEVLLQDIADTGVALVATKEISRAEEVDRI